MAYFGNRLLHSPFPNPSRQVWFVMGFGAFSILLPFNGSADPSTPPGPSTPVPCPPDVIVQLIGKTGSEQFEPDEDDRVTQPPVEVIFARRTPPPTTRSAASGRPTPIIDAANRAPADLPLRMETPDSLLTRTRAVILSQPDAAAIQTARVATRRAAATGISASVVSVLADLPRPFQTVVRFGPPPSTTPATLPFPSGVTFQPTTSGIVPPLDLRVVGTFTHRQANGTLTPITVADRLRMDGIEGATPVPVPQESRSGPAQFFFGDAFYFRDPAGQLLRVSPRVVRPVAAPDPPMLFEVDPGRYAREEGIAYVRRQLTHAVLGNALRWRDRNLLAVQRGPINLSPADLDRASRGIWAEPAEWNPEDLIPLDVLHDAFNLQFHAPGSIPANEAFLAFLQQMPGSSPNAVIERAERILTQARVNVRAPQSTDRTISGEDFRTILAAVLHPELRLALDRAARSLNLAPFDPLLFWDARHRLVRMIGMRTRPALTPVAQAGTGRSDRTAIPPPPPQQPLPPPLRSRPSGTR